MDVETRSLNVRLKRLFYMLSEKGIRYTANFLFMAATYNSDFIRKILLVKLYPWCVFYPRYIEIEVTTRCNLRCIMCEHTYWDIKPRDLTLDQFGYIVDQFPRLKWIGVTGIGSSFLNRDFLDMLRYVKKKNVYVELFDSFNNLNEEIIDQVVREGLIDRFIASVDAATKDTYERIRVGADFDKVLNNVKTLVKAKRKYRTHFPEFSFHYIISRLNFEEMPDFVRLIHQVTGGDNVGILFTKLLHTFEQVEDIILEELPEEIRSQTVSLARQLGIRLMWTKDLRENRQPVIECTEWTMPFIFADGSVIPCCAGNEANRREFQVRTRMGNILSQDFESIWNGQKFRDLRDRVHRGETPEPCVDCPVYEVTGKSRAHQFANSEKNSG
ncbi:MAG: radical SAM protein [Planctomycetota bacterium]